MYHFIVPETNYCINLYIHTYVCTCTIFVEDRRNCFQKSIFDSADQNTLSRRMYFFNQIDVLCATIKNVGCI